MGPIDHRKAALWLAAAFALFLAIFVLWPGLDLQVSAAFHTPGAGFLLASDAALQGIRGFIWSLSIAVVFLSALVLILAVIHRPTRAFAARPAGFVFLLYLLGPILLVNGLLKRYWGRARPADIAEFGGVHSFTPPWLPADQCAANCSFVSGEGAAATALALSLLILAPALWRVLPRWAFCVYAGLAVLLPLMGIALRVAMGRHFLSDTIFAVLFVLAIALGLHRALLRGPNG